MPRGGKRSGAGRKSHTTRIVLLRGGDDRGQVRPVEAEIASRPELGPDVGEVWDKLAPQATKAGTLVATTAEAFVRLCEDIVKHAEMERQITRDGMTYLKVTIDGSGQEHNDLKAHPLLSRAHALNMAIRSGLKDFALNPFGKPLAAPTKAVDPFEQFENAG